MLVKIGTYTLPDTFMAFTNVGENNKRYIDMVGIITGINRNDLQKKVDEFLDSVDGDSATIYIGNDTRGIKSVKNSPEAVSMDMFDASPSAVIKLTFRAEDKAEYDESGSIYSITKSANVYIEGNDDTYPKITVHFTGGSTSLSIANSLSAQTFELTETFESGDSLIVDSTKQELQKNGVIMIEESEGLEYIKLQNGKNVLTLTADGATGMLVEYEDKHL